MIAPTLADLFNRFFREIGCQFSDDQPGPAFEQLTTLVRRLKTKPGPGTPIYPHFEKIVALPGHPFSCPDESKQAIELLWQLIVGNANVLPLEVLILLTNQSAHLRESGNADSSLEFIIEGLTALLATQDTDTDTDFT